MNKTSLPPVHYPLMTDYFVDHQRMERLARRAHYRVDTMAARMHISRRWLEHLFLRRFGQSPRTWLRALKLRDAQALLRQGELKKDVATALGYAHFSNFSRAFSAQLASYKASPRRRRKVTTHQPLRKRRKQRPTPPRFRQKHRL